MKRVLLFLALILATYIGFAQDAAQLIESGNEALTAKDYAKAFELYDSAMKNLGDVQVDDAINFNIGYAAFQSENYDAAISYFDKAIAAGANTATSYKYEGDAYNKMEDYPAAITAYNNAIESGYEDKGALYYNSGIAAYKGSLFDQAVDLFTNAANENYNAANAIYYEAASLSKLGKTDEYKQTLVDGAEKFPSDEKITSALAKIYVSEGNELYKKGVGIINAANEKVTAGTISTADDAYTAEIEKSKVEFNAALEVLEKAQALDATNQNATTLIEACKSLLSS